MEKQKIEISTTTLLKIAVIVLGLWLIYLIKEVVILFIFVLIIVAALDPIIDWFEVRKIPRPASIVLVYIVIFSLFGLLVYLVMPPLISQIIQLAQDAPLYFHKLQALGEAASGWQKALLSVSSQLSKLTGGLWQATLTIFGGLVSFLTVIFLSIYMLWEERGIKKSLINFWPEHKKEQISFLFNKVETKLGGWLQGQLILCLIIGIVTYIGLLIMKVPYALVLAILAAVLEIIPYFGPIIAGIMAILVAYFLGGGVWQAVAVLILYVVVQQIESQILVPKIMQKSVGLSPVIIILALLIGAKLLGLVGIILAIPVAAGLSVLIAEWPNLRKTE